MAKKNSTKRTLHDLSDKFASGEEILTSAEIAMAYKATLVDFVRGKTTRPACDTVSRLLKGALEARRADLEERIERPTQYF